MNSVGEAATDQEGGLRPQDFAVLAIIAIWTILTVMTMLPAWSKSVLVANLAHDLLILFGLVHGHRRFGTKGIAVFFLIAVVVGMVVEGLSIHTGFPFGSYVHNVSYGAKVLDVPLVIGPAYFGFSYLYWTMAEGIWGPERSAQGQKWLIGLPLLGAFIGVGHDLCFDPYGGTVKQAWTYEFGGSYYGEPITAFFGWFILNWAIMQTFAVYQSSHSDDVRPVAQRHWYTMLGFWIVIAAQYPFRWLLTYGQSVEVTDNVGWIWRSGDVVEGSALTAIFNMLPMALLFYLTISRRSNSQE